MTIVSFLDVTKKLPQLGRNMLEAFCRVLNYLHFGPTTGSLSLVLFEIYYFKVLLVTEENKFSVFWRNSKAITSTSKTLKSFL